MIGEPRRKAARPLACSACRTIPEAERLQAAVRNGYRDMPSLKNQIAVVTGSTGGIGGAIAAALAQHEATLCLLGRDQAKLDAAVARLQTASPRPKAYLCDLTTDSDVGTVCEQVAGAYERIDILVHCAGAIDHGKLADAPLTSLDQQYKANVRGPLMLTQKMLPLLKKPRGQIVFINSSAGLNARANTGHFAATQHAFRALADSLRDEVNADGIRVMSVFPGRTATPRIEAVHKEEGRPFQPGLLLQPEDVASVVLNALVLPWTAEVTNISIRSMQKSY
jgi:NADP-dependent 3-hydroxy acid dehydrogenase YdfG